MTKKILRDFCDPTANIWFSLLNWIKFIDLFLKNLTVFKIFGSFGFETSRILTTPRSEPKINKLSFESWSAQVNSEQIWNSEICSRFSTSHQNNYPDLEIVRTKLYFWYSLMKKIGDWWNFPIFSIVISISILLASSSDCLKKIKN